MKKALMFLLFTRVASFVVVAQDTTPPATTDQQNQQVEPMDKMPLFKVRVVGRTTKAVNYRHRGGSTTVELKGTERMPEITGRAKVDGKAGRLAIGAELQKMPPARS